VAVMRAGLTDRCRFALLLLAAAAAVGGVVA